tara:strand:+ start:11935 stop:12186 length:252 start_codon:yes stop_codon:yes gene_type:complete
MKKQSRSILDEINESFPKRNLSHVVESRGSHVISSAINLVNLINENFSEDVANDLTRRLLNSIKAGDPNKFERGIRKVEKHED